MELVGGLIQNRKEFASLFATKDFVLCLLDPERRSQFIQAAQRTRSVVANEQAFSVLCGIEGFVSCLVNKEHRTRFMNKMEKAKKAIGTSPRPFTAEDIRTWALS